jgi:carbamoyltransferase
VTPGAFGSPEGERLFHDELMKVEPALAELGFRGTFHFLPHHDCHAASAFFVSPFEQAAVLVIDGIGEWESTTSYHGRGHRLEHLNSVGYPNSIGLLWEKISKLLGFSEYDACKVMGLASYGDGERFLPHFESLLHIGEDGGFTLDDSVVRLRNEDYSALEELFGFARLEGPIRRVEERYRDPVDVAAALQRVTEKAVLALARDVKRRTGSRHLCLAGGVALNCVANGQLIDANLFEDVFIQPAAHDGGTALGAAYLLWHRQLDRPRSMVFGSPYLGPSFSEQDMRQALEARGLVYERPERIEKAAARLIAEEQVVGWFQGAMELGPRALGNRSILADPRRADMLEVLNKKVKHREAFRPLCPSVLAEEAEQWFHLDRPSLPAGYMLTTHTVRDDRRERIPAVTHVDGSSRIQLVTEEANALFYQLIRELHGLTGIPIVLNTSFNNSEPIVCSPQNAIATFLETRIDALVLGPFLVLKEKNAIDGTIPEMPLKRYFENLR